MTPSNAVAYAALDGIRMYYEASGEGDPIVLLGGGLADAHVFDNQVPALSERYRVIVPEQRGRGHTADVDGPITYQILAEDMITFIERVVAGPTHLVGVSDGGVVGILLGIQRPDLLRKLVTIGANFHGDGLLRVSLWTDASPDDEAWAVPRQRYTSVSPDGPDHFPLIFEKLQQMWRDGQPTLTERDLAQIPVPVLVVAGDDDVIHHAHTVALYESVPHGQLAIIPGASHAVFMEKPELLNQMILDFLAEDAGPETLLPVRRSQQRSVASQSEPAR